VLAVAVERDSLRIGERLVVRFERTLRVPDDGRTYPLPPGLGAFPIHRVEDYGGRIPAGWRERGELFIPMYQREAMWIRFSGTRWKPNSVKVGVGRIDAVSGAPWDEALHASPQDYLVCPDQPWLDGINAGRGFIRQFVAMPLGEGYTVEGQLTGVERVGGIQMVVFEPRPGRFPDRPPPDSDRSRQLRIRAMAAPAAELGLAPGGKIEQRIYPDPHGVETWDPGNRGDVFVHIVNTDEYRQITGRETPPTPVDARTYTEAGYPWFRLYDEARGDLAPAGPLAGLASVHEVDAGRGEARPDDERPLALPDEQVKRLGPRRRRRR